MVGDVLDGISAEKVTPDSAAKLRRIGKIANRAADKAEALVAPEKPEPYEFDMNAYLTPAARAVVEKANDKLKAQLKKKEADRKRLADKREAEKKLLEKAQAKIAELEKGPKKPAEKPAKEADEKPAKAAPKKDK